MKPLSATQRARLDAAVTYARSRMEQNHAAEDIIAGLVAHHGASLKLRPCGNSLRCGGVTCNCTWSATDGLLKGWYSNATHRLIMENYR